MTNTDDYSDVFKRLSAVRIDMLRKQPFFATLSYALENVVDTTLPMPTAGTNGEVIKWHPAFVRSLKQEELLFVNCHEILHAALHHTTRIKFRNPELWNVAIDIVVNQILVDDKVGAMPPMGILDPEMFKRGEGLAERIYDLIRQDNEDGKGKYQNFGKPGAQPGGTKTGDGKGPLDNVEGPPDGSPSANQDQELKWKMNVAQAADIAKRAGNLSANIQRLVGDVLDPKVPWQDLLREFMTPCRDDERTWKRPARRFMAHNMYLPSTTGEAMGDIVVAVDCSGSIGERELNEFATEIKAIQEDTRPANVHIVYFDSAVCHYDVFDRNDPVQIRPHGGGGTAFSPIFRYVEKHDLSPEVCVVLTDLCCSDHGIQPEYPVLWVTTMKGEAPWGKVIEMF